MPENLNDPIQIDANNIYAEVLEIDEHFHAYERWLGQIAVPTETRFADATETTFQIDSGNAVFGSWVQILGSADTPVTAGKTIFDLHRLLITAAEQTTIYRVQFAFGATGDAAYAAGDYIEVVFQKGLGVPAPSPVDMQGNRHDAGTVCWARCRCSSNTGTLNFLIGLHEYDS